MRVRVSAKGTTLDEDALDGTRILDGDAGLRFTLLLPDAGAATRHELRYGGERPWENKDRAIPFEADGREVAATLTPELLDALESAHLTFVVTTTTLDHMSTASHHTRPDDTPFDVVVDLDAPRAGATILRTNGVAIDVVFAGADNETAIASYRGMVREGSGVWAPWISEIHETGATYSGAPGKTYTFRVAAVDGVGHVSAWTETRSATIDPRLPANRAPTLDVLAPAHAIEMRGPIEILVDAADPDATTPLVKACALVDGIQTLCAPETTAARFPIDDAALPDGPVTLRIDASDGSMSAAPIERTITLDRAPPTMRDVRAQPHERGALLTLVSDATAVTAEITHADGARVGVVPLVSESGVWTARPPLERGDYTILFHARDAAGNVATDAVQLALSDANAQPPAPEEVVAEAPPAPESVAPQSTKGVPMPLALAVFAAICAALTRGARARR